MKVILITLVNHECLGEAAHLCILVEAFTVCLCSKYQILLCWLIGPRREKTCLRGFAENTGSDQPAHPCRLISAFVICLSRSIISRRATSEISIF